MRFIALTGFLVSLVGSQPAAAKDWVGVLICGDVPSGLGCGDSTATLWSNGIDKGGFGEFWNDTFLMWELLYQLGYADEDIHVLFDKGDDWEVDWDRYWAPPGIWNITDDSSYKADVIGIFTALAEGDSAQGIEAMTDDDFFFCWTFGHGGPDFPPPDSMSVYLQLMKHWETQSWDKIWDTTFARYADSISCKRRVFWMQQCRSGGFRNDLENDKTVFLSACEWTEKAWYADDSTAAGEPIVENEVGEDSVKYYHGEFNFHTMNAVRGEKPWGDPVDADIDGDGFVSIEEVKQWEFTHDSRYLFWGWSTPQYHDPGNIGFKTFLNATPIVSGHITENTTWETDRTVFVRGDVVVDSGVTLTIESGTTVKFLADFDAEASGADPNRCELVVQGTLIAEGTASEPIVFTSIGADPQPGDWYGIRFLDSSVDSACAIKNCHIGYAHRGISCDLASPEISQNQIDKCEYGIYCVDRASPEISDNKLNDISGCGIYCYSDCSPTVVSDTLIGKGYYDSWGIHCWNSSPQIQDGVVENFERGINCCGGDPVITGVRLSNNTQYGIACNVSGFPPGESECDPSSPTITDNTIYGSDRGIFTGSLSEAYIANNTIFDNQMGIRSDNSPSVVFGNRIMQNDSVGVYCLGSNLPNLGDLSNTDTTDDGYNEICGNRDFEVVNEASGTVMAENNWWGQYPPQSSQFNGPIDYDPAMDHSPDTTAPAAITDLSVTLIKVPSDSAVVLSWSEISTDVEGKLEFISHYVIYRDITPDFEASSQESLAAVPDTSFEYFDSGVVGNAAINYFYVVKAVDYGANKSVASNMVGEFDIGLTEKGEGTEPPWP